jgi:peptidoglycan/xylan/chitin deacetylase (PgdA/CDA1 family)
MCIVLEYHGVPAQLRADFAGQMDVARRIATPLPADWHAPLEPSRNYFVVTFDDGLSSIVENAVPELEKRAIPAAVFVVSGGLGAIPAWTSYSTAGSWAPAGRSTERMLTAEQLRQLSGRVLIGSHSVTHPMLTEVDEIQARYELESSRMKLSYIIGYNVVLFSLPYGDFSENILAYCRDAGYERVFTSLPMRAFSQPGEFVSGRVSVNPSDWPLEFRLKVLGAYRWLPYAIACKRTLFSALPVCSRRTEKAKKNYAREKI